MSRIAFAPDNKKLSIQPPRDSLELASLASSSAQTVDQESITSSPSGISSSRKLSLENEDPFLNNNATLGSARPRSARSYSVSSAFDFGSNMFPLSQTAGGYAPLGAPSLTSLDRHNGGADGSLEKFKTLTYVNGLSLIVGIIIGSGIFSSPSQVNSNAGSPGAALVIWAVAGVLAWTGAASYAELGGAIPLNGGAQAYLSKIFGELMGFLFTWVAVFVLKPGSSAIISIIFGEYIVRAIVGADAEDVNPWINKAVALVTLFIITFVNCVSTKIGVRIGDMLMFFKFIALLGVTIIGIIVAATGLSYSGEANKEWKTTGWFDGTNTDVSSLAVALYAGLWAFDGWDNTNYVTGEFRNPHRDLPRVIHTAMPLVILCYILANLSYIFVLPHEIIEGSNTVAVQFGSKVFGPIGALVLALVVSASCFGTLNASTFTSGRLVYAAAREGYMPSVFAKLGLRDSTNPAGSRLKTRSCTRNWLSKVFGSELALGYTPIYAMTFNALLCAGYLAVGEFGTLVTFYGVAGYTFYFLTVLGLIVLRIKEPYLERPYKTWITTPIIFCCVSLFLLSRAVLAQPWQTLIVVGFIVLGIPVYYWRIHQRDGKSFFSGSWQFWKRRRRP